MMNSHFPGHILRNHVNVILGPRWWTASILHTLYSLVQSHNHAMIHGGIHHSIMSMRIFPRYTVYVDKTCLKRAAAPTANQRACTIPSRWGPAPNRHLSVLSLSLARWSIRSRAPLGSRLVFGPFLFSSGGCRWSADGDVGVSVAL